MKKLRKITLLASVLVALGLPSLYAAATPEEMAPTRTTPLQSPPPRNPFAGESTTDVPPPSIGLEALGPLVNPEEDSSANRQRGPGTVKLVTKNLAATLGIAFEPSSPTIAPSQKSGTSETIIPLSPEPPPTAAVPEPPTFSLPETTPVPATSVPSTIPAPTPSVSLAPTEGGGDPRNGFSFLSCFPCMNNQASRSAIKRPSTSGSLQNFAPPTTASSALDSSTARALLASPAPEEIIAPKKDEYANVSANGESSLLEGEEDTQPTDPEGAVQGDGAGADPLSEPLPSKDAAPVDAASNAEGVLVATGASAPHSAADSAASHDSVTLPKKKKGPFGWWKSKEKAGVAEKATGVAGEALPTSNTDATGITVLSPTDVYRADETAHPTTLAAATAVPSTPEEQKKKNSSCRSCWSRTKKKAAAVESALEEGFVDVAPYLAGGLKFVAASTPNPAIQAVINFLALSIEEGASALSRNGATIHIKKRNGEELTAASPPFLHAQNFVSTGRLSDESIMLITIALDRMNRASNYEQLIGLINIIVAQDSNNSPETLGFDEGSGAVLLYPNNSTMQIPLLSVSIMKNLKDPLLDTRNQFGYAILEYIEAAQKRSAAEDTLGRLLSGNFLPTDQSWVRVPYQELVNQGSPFLLKELDVLKGVDSTVWAEIEEKRSALLATPPKESARISFP